MAVGLVSIIVTVYQGDSNEYLRLSLESILAQTYPNLEVIIVVDGPIDAQKDTLIAKYNRYHNFEIIRLLKNQGPSAARNAGICKAKGSYIAIMDADDICHKDRIIKQIFHIERGDLDLIGSSTYIINEDNEIIGERIMPLSPSHVRDLAPYSCPVNNPTVLAKADLLKKYLYNERYRVSEDYDLWVRLLCSGYKLGNIDFKTLFYRQSPSDIMKRRGVRYAIADIRVKFRAAKLVAPYKRLSVYLLAIFASIGRCLPEIFFIRLYRFKNKLFSKKFSFKLP